VRYSSAVPSALAPRPQISVVIPTYGRRAQLARVVDALLADEATAEVIVVVDGSDDGSLELLRAIAHRDPRVRPIWTAKRGQAAARQLGVEAARYPVVLLLDDDVLAGPGMVSGHAAHHAGRADLVVVGAMPVPEPVRATGGVPAQLYATWYDQQVRFYVAEPERILHSLWAGNVSLPRAAALRVGCVSPDFCARYSEDRDFGLRLLRAGLHARFDPALRAEHHFERSPRDFLTQAVAAGQGARLVHELHGDIVGPFQADEYLAYLSPAIAAAVALAQRPRGRPLISGAVAAARVSGALGLRRLERRALTAAFHMIRLRAARGYHPGP
jgi:glycosyltransferase involved in cell wall biosynthesis